MYENIINERMESLKDQSDLLNNIIQKSNFSKDVFISESILSENNENQNKNENFSNVETRFITNIIKKNKEEIQKKKKKKEMDIEKKIYNKNDDKGEWKNDEIKKSNNYKICE